VIIPRRRIDELQSHLMLCFTGLSRIASEVAQDQIANMGRRERELHRMRAMVDEAVKILHSATTPIEQFGKLRDSWMLKKELSAKVSTAEVDELYAAARAAGATGGKLLGAGGGGFLLLFVKPELQARVKERLKHLVHVPFGFDEAGSRVVLYQPNGLH
jgi:D-glycero-alpha-D-manno-heptose-7-phosphate kinase